MFGHFAKLDSPRRAVQFWQNFQTSLVLLIPNCTRHRMITYTNFSLATHSHGWQYYLEKQAGIDYIQRTSRYYFPLHYLYNSLQVTAYSTIQCSFEVAQSRVAISCSCFEVEAQWINKFPHCKLLNEDNHLKSGQ